MKQNYIFVDYENVHDVDLALMDGKPVVVELVLGEQHKNLPVSMVERLLARHAQIKLVKAGKSGRNALDFVLAYRVGVVSAADPKGFFHIVSRDTGFDALVAHLKLNGILARRDESFAKAFEMKEPAVVPAEDRLKVVTEKLGKNKTNRPKRKKTLLSHINSYFGNKLTEAELEDMVLKLTASGIIEIGEKGGVTYHI